MAIQPVEGIRPWATVDGLGGATDAGRTPAPGFANALASGLQQVSDLEHHADALINDVAVGGPTTVHEMMAATTKSQLAVDLLVAVRDRALEAYNEVMRLQL